MNGRGSKEGETEKKKKEGKIKIQIWEVTAGTIGYDYDSFLKTS